MPDGLTLPAGVLLPTGVLVKRFETSDNGARNRVKRWLILGGVGIAMLLIAGLISGSQNRATGDIYTLFALGGPMAILISGLLLLVTVPHAIRKPEYLDVHDDGFVLRDRSTTTPKRAASWSQVEDIVRPQKMEVDGMAGAGASMGFVGMLAAGALGAAVNESVRKENETHAIIVVPGQGKLTIDDRFWELNQLNDKLRELAIPHWENEAVAAIEANKSYPVGKFTVSKAGIALKNHFAAWDKIREVTWFDAGATTTLMVRYEEAGKKNLQSFANPLGLRGDLLINLARRYAAAIPKPKYDLSKPI